MSKRLYLHQCPWQLETCILNNHRLLVTDDDLPRQRSAWPWRGCDFHAAIVRPGIGGSRRWEALLDQDVATGSGTIHSSGSTDHGAHLSISTSGALQCHRTRRPVKADFRMIRSSRRPFMTGSHSSFMIATPEGLIVHVACPCSTLAWGNSVWENLQICKSPTGNWNYFW